MQVELTQEQAQALVYFATVGMMAMIDFDASHSQEQLNDGDSGVTALIVAQS